MSIKVNYFAMKMNERYFPVGLISAQVNKAVNLPRTALAA